MSILDSILGGLMGGNSAQSPVGGILGSLLGGGGQQGGGMGGLGGLLSQFQKAGMGGVANSWVSNGPNQQVSPDQLQQVFGQQQVNQWAQQSNMQPHDLLSQLSQFLPHAVDRMTPGGQMPGGQMPDGADPFGGAGVNLGSGSGGQQDTGNDPFGGAGTNLGSRRS